MEAPLPTNAPNPPMVRLYHTNPWRLPESPSPLTVESLVYKVTHTPDKYCTCCEFVSRDDGLNGMWVVVGPYAVGDPPEFMAPGIVPTGDVFCTFCSPQDRR